MTPDWPALRKQFPVTERCIYLNTGWSGPSSREGVAAMQQRLEREAYDGPTTLEVRNEKALLVRRVRGAIAALIRADIDEVAITYTTTDCVNTVLRGIGLKPGDNVVTCNLEHNAVMVPSYLTRNRDGIDLSIVRLSPEQAAREVLDAFDAAITPATKLVLVSHVSYNRGTRLPIREITEIAHSRGALVAVDAAQSAGQIDFDVRDLNCDFHALPGHKWLLGPDGAAFLYVRSELIEFLQPLAVVHGANRNYDFEGNFDYANDTIHKFELTTHSGPVLAGLEVSLQMVAQLGVPTIEARCLALADRFIAGLQRIDDVRITTPLDPALRSGIVTLAIRDHDPNQVAAALYASGRVIARVCNNRRVRVCFHIFNDESDVDRTLDAIEHIAKNGLPPGTMTAQQYKDLLLESED